MTTTVLDMLAHDRLVPVVVLDEVMLRLDPGDTTTATAAEFLKLAGGGGARVDR